MTKTRKNPDNQIIWIDSSKSAVALCGFVWLCLALFSYASPLALASQVPPHSLNRCIPQRRVGPYRRRIFSGFLPQPGNQVPVFVGN